MRDILIPNHRGSGGVTRGSLRRCRPGWRWSRGDRADVSWFVLRDYDRWRTALFWAPLYGDPVWLEASSCRRRKTAIGISNALGASVFRR